jgi:hypothetical protein
MWTVVAVITVLAVVALFGLLIMAGLVDPDPHNSQPPSNHHI